MLVGMSRIVSYANVASTLALVVALSGGAYAATKLPKNSVGSPQIKNGAVAAADLANGSVTGSKLGTGTVTAPKLATGAVTGPKIAAGSVDSSKIANGSVTAADLAPGLLSGLGSGSAATQSGAVRAASQSFTCGSSSVSNYVPAVTVTVKPREASRVLVSANGGYSRVVTNTGQSYNVQPRVEVLESIGGETGLAGSARGGMGTTSDAANLQAFSVGGLALAADGTPLVLDAGGTYQVTLDLLVYGCSGVLIQATNPELSFLLVPNAS
jgi:hypothetical protein